MPAGYTHVLKVDDDVYLRIDQALLALRAPAGADQSAPPRPRALPATRQQLAEEVARMGGGTVLHSDGIQLYNATLLVKHAGDAAGAHSAVPSRAGVRGVPAGQALPPTQCLTLCGICCLPSPARKTLDDAEGETVTLAELAAAAAAAAARKHLRAGGGGGETAAEQERQPDDGSRTGPSLDGTAAAHPPRMTGVYLGCMENKVRADMDWSSKAWCAVRGLQKAGRCHAPLPRSVHAPTRRRTHLDRCRGASSRSATPPASGACVCGYLWVLR